MRGSTIRDFNLHNRHFCAIIGKKEGEDLLCSPKKSLSPQENIAAMVNCFACMKLHIPEETKFYQPIVVARK